MLRRTNGHGFCRFIQRDHSMLTFETASIQGVGGIVEKLTVCLVIGLIIFFLIILNLNLVDREEALMLTFFLLAVEPSFPKGPASGCDL